MVSRHDHCVAVNPWCPHSADKVLDPRMGQGKDLFERRDGACMWSGWVSPGCWYYPVDAMPEVSFGVTVHVSPSLFETLTSERARSDCCAQQGDFSPGDGCLCAQEKWWTSGGSTAVLPAKGSCERPKLLEDRTVLEGVGVGRRIGIWLAVGCSGHRVPLFDSCRFFQGFSVLE